jgi:sporulation protein YlmC with PRC-barrel domain
MTKVIAPSHQGGFMKLSQLSMCVGFVSVLMIPMSHSLADDHRVKGSQDLFKASEMIGKNVENPKGDNLGKVEDIVIDTTGEVGYAVLSFGGFLGMGDKLFAVPWHALAHSQDGKQLILDVPKDKLENAPGFDKNNWPDMKDAQFRSGISSFYPKTQKTQQPGVH